MVAVAEPNGVSSLVDRGAGAAGGAAVGSFEEAGCGGAVLGVALELVLDVGDGAGGVALVELQGAVALFAAELGVAVQQGVGYGFYLPEGLIAPGGADATAFNFALKELLGNCNNFGGHGAFLRAGLACGEAL
jgi:hypothetical protein